MTLKSLTKDGSEIDVDLSVSSVNISGQWYAVGILRDVTEQKRMAELLRESEERYRSLYVDSRDAVMVLSPEQGFLAANPATIKLFGCRDEEDFTSYTPAALSPERQPDGVLSTEKAQEMMRLALKNGSHFFEWTHCKTDGTPFPATVLLSRFEHGDTRLLMATARDITENKRAEDALRESENLLARSQQIAQVGSWMLEAGANRLTWSDEVYRIFGLDPQEFSPTYEGFLEAVHPEDRAAVDEAYWGSLREAKDAYEIEHRIVRRRTGEVRHVHEKCVHERDGAGEVLRSVGMVQDITERKHAEEKLRESEEKYRTLIEDSIEGIAITKGNQILFANRALLDICGYDSFEELAQDSMLDVVAPEDRPRVYERVLRRESGQPEESPFEFRILRKDGAKRDVRTQSADITIGNRRFTQTTFQDITAWKRAEAARQSLEMTVQHKQKLESLGVLAGGIAHDFNNILNIIRGNVHHLQKTVPETASARRFVDNVERSVARAEALTRQMLAYSGKGHFLLQVLDLSDVVKEIIQLLQSSVSKKVTLQTNLAKDLPPIEADIAQIQQVAMNLILNASEALDEDRGGMVEISTMALHCTDDYLRESRALFNVPEGDYVCLEVRDTGCGMNKETRERLFEPFFTTKFTGRGLGMAAVLGIIRGHRGSIFVESAPDKGTTIRALFPVAIQPVPVTADNAPPSPAAPSGRTGTILFVDDERDMLELGALALEQMGYTVLTAADGLEALEVFRSRHEDINCVLLDLSMPRLDGVQTLAELRGIKPGIHVILASGYAEQELKARLVGQKVDAFIEKPYNFKAVSALLQEFL